MSDRIAVMRGGRLAGRACRAPRRRPRASWRSPSASTAQACASRGGTLDASARSYRRELAAAAAWGLLLLAVAFVAPPSSARDNLRDLALEQRAGAAGRHRDDARDPRRPDRHLGRLAVRGRERVRRPARQGGRSQRRCCWRACSLLGAALGAVNGVLVGASGAAVDRRDARDARRLARRAALGHRGRVGAGSAAGFQWFGLGQARGQWLIVAVALVGARGARLGCSATSPAGRARLRRRLRSRGRAPRGHRAGRVIFGVFVLMGALTGLAALLNAVRFSAVPGNVGIGLELKAIAAVVVGGTAISGGRGTLVGHPPRRGAARHDRPGADLPRDQPVLGEGHPGRDHPGRAGVGPAAWDGWRDMQSPSPAEPRVRVERRSASGCSRTASGRCCSCSPSSARSSPRPAPTS